MNKCVNCMHFIPRGLLTSRLGFCQRENDKVIYVEGDDTCENWKSYDCREAKYQRFLHDFFYDWDFVKWGDIPPEMLQRAEDAFNALSKEEMKCL